MNGPLSLQQQLQSAIDNKTKPPGSLGRLEAIALQAGLIQNTISPTFTAPHLLVFAGDHGIAATGLVNPYPQKVTAQMVLNFINGGAAINVFCRQHRINLKIIDAGVNDDFAGIDHADFIRAKMGWGTGNYSITNAMSEDCVDSCIRTGQGIVAEIVSRTGSNCIGFGEMGIGNTSSASLIMSAVTGLSIADCTGKGTGANDEQLSLKVRMLTEVHAFHHLQHYGRSPVQLLSRIGGFEIAMMTGAYLQAKEEKMIIVVDGFIATAALLLACQLDSCVRENCIFAHTSGEKGHAQMLDFLKAKPLFDLGLRLGEGTGAALAMPLIQSAVSFLNEMASFQSAAISNRQNEKTA